MIYVSYWLLIIFSFFYFIFFLAELITGLVENNLHYYSYLLTGYIRCPLFLKKVAEVYKILKEKNPDLIFGK